MPTFGSLLKNLKDEELRMSQDGKVVNYVKIEIRGQGVNQADQGLREAQEIIILATGADLTIMQMNANIRNLNATIAVS